MKNIVLAVGLVVLAALACVAISCARARTPNKTETAAVDCPPGAKFCVTPQTNPPAAEPEVAFDQDGRQVGKLLEPVRAQVRLYDADGTPPRDAATTVPAGVWLIPEAALAEPIAGTGEEK